jgi:hypothetical protein
MQLYLAKIVNRGLVGEPEHICLQIESNKIFEFSQILGESINDNDLSHPIIQAILNNGHQVNITFDENNNVTLHF